MKDAVLKLKLQNVVQDDLKASENVPFARTYESGKVEVSWRKFEE